MLIAPPFERGRRSLAVCLPRLAWAALFEVPSLPPLLVREYAVTGPVRALAQAWRSMDYPMERALAAVTAPTLVVHGELDPLVSGAWAERLAGVLRRSHLATVERVGHAAHYSAAAVTAGLIGRFLSGQMDVDGGVPADAPHRDPHGPPQPLAVEQFRSLSGWLAVAGRDRSTTGGRRPGAGRAVPGPADGDAVGRVGARRAGDSGEPAVSGRAGARGGRDRRCRPHGEADGAGGLPAGELMRTPVLTGPSRVAEATLPLTGVKLRRVFDLTAIRVRLDGAGWRPLPPAGPPLAVLWCDADTGRTTLQASVERTWDDPRAALDWMAADVRGTDRRWIGYLGYDLGRWFERLPAPPPPAVRLPLFVFTLHGPGDAPSAFEVTPPRSTVAAADFTRAAYEAAVGRAIGYVRAGDVFQVNLSQRFAVPTADAAAVYARLPPAVYGGCLDYGRFAIVTHSPELLLRATPDGRVVTRPIKGTRPNRPGMAEQLRDSAKDAAELNMIVDLERNDLGRVCEIGTVPRGPAPHGRVTPDGAARRGHGRGPTAAGRDAGRLAGRDVSPAGA